MWRSASGKKLKHNKAKLSYSNAAKPKARKSSWKKYQTTGQTKKNIWLAILVLLFIGSLIVIAKLINFVTQLDQPYLSDNSSDPRMYGWDGQSDINLVVKSDHLYAFSYDPNERSVNIMKIPDDTYLNVSYGFGSWPARSVYSLGQSENPPIGAKLLLDSVENELGIPIDGYIFLTGQESDQPFDQVVNDVRGNLFGTLNVIRSSKTNLSIWEMIKLWQGVKGVRFDKVKYVDLGQSPVTKSQKLPDGSSSLVFDSLKLDPFVQSNFEDEALRGEGLSVAVFNSTGQYRLAETAARMIQNIGGRVIFTGSVPTSIDKTVVFGSDSYTKTRLEETFAPRCLTVRYGLFNLFSRSPDCSYKNDQVDFSRADVVIVLGEDFASREK